MYSFLYITWLHQVHFWEFYCIVEGALFQSIHSQSTAIFCSSVPDHWLCSLGILIMFGIFISISFHFLVVISFYTNVVSVCAVNSLPSLSGDAVLFRWQGQYFWSVYVWRKAGLLWPEKVALCGPYGSFRMEKGSFVCGNGYWKRG